MTQRRIEEGVPPPGHIIDDTGRVRRVLGTLPLTADGCVAGIGAKVINPMGEEWLACVRSYAHEPGAEDDDPNCLLADCRAPLADPDAGGGEGPFSSDEALARFFHDTYERLAPSFGYETRPETRTFDPASKNGRLMLAVMREVRTVLASGATMGVYDATLAEVQAALADPDAGGGGEGGAKA